MWQATEGSSIGNYYTVISAQGQKLCTKSHYLIAIVCITHCVVTTPVKHRLIKIMIQESLNITPYQLVAINPSIYQKT